MPLKQIQRWSFWTLAGLALLLFWDALQLDMPMARWFGSVHGFAWQHHWLLAGPLHEGARSLGWLLVILLTVAIRWPVGVLKRLSRGQRTRLVLGILVALLVIAMIKQSSLSSCPWDLTEFGGPAHYVPHWLWGVPDGGGGHCFPAGHASTGFAFIAGYFCLHDQAPRQARWWLGAALFAGFALGLVQQIRGAHYMSHVLWSAWFCWISTGASHVVSEYFALKLRTPELGLT
ncbi:MAG: phosphatase PAP2 family protein [Polaromonas sp.]|nr:phosphatase PAP2 family protein [Polaromonas sp.]